MGRRRRADEVVEIAAQIEHQTPGAYLLNDGARKEWFPKSVTEDNKDGTFTVPYNMAHEKGFI
jgi:hypothetical protein